MSKSEGPASTSRAASVDILRLPENFSEVVLKNVFEIWFRPEIERRRDAGLLNDGFELLMAQVIFPEEAPNEIRLNDEVRGIMTVEAQRPIQKGEPATLADLQYVQAFELEGDELDCGHFTVIRQPSGWMLAFNALAGRKKAANFVRLAGEFLEAAKLARDRSQSGPSIDNLFSCCELLSKAELIMHRLGAPKSKRHGHVHTVINAWGRMGNVPSEFVSTMNRLSNSRSAARYEGTTGADDLPTEAEFEAVEQFALRLKRSSEPKISE